MNNLRQKQACLQSAYIPYLAIVRVEPVASKDACLDVGQIQVSLNRIFPHEWLHGWRVNMHLQYKIRGQFFIQSAKKMNCLAFAFF